MDLERQRFLYRKDLQLYGQDRLKERQRREPRCDEVTLMLEPWARKVGPSRTCQERACRSVSPCWRSRLAGDPRRMTGRGTEARGTCPSTSAFELTDMRNAFYRERRDAWATHLGILGIIVNLEVRLGCFGAVSCRERGFAFLSPWVILLIHPNRQICH